MVRQERWEEIRRLRETHRYSVPFTLIGQPVEVLRRDGQVRIFHRGRVVAEHPELAGKYQVRILPEHGPGAIARTARRVRSTGAALLARQPPCRRWRSETWPSTRPS